jgi:hypothetical protein
LFFCVFTASCEQHIDGDTKIGFPFMFYFSASGKNENPNEDFFNINWFFIDFLIVLCFFTLSRFILLYYLKISPSNNSQQNSQRRQDTDGV